MIPLYILGILQRYGPSHGYQIKKYLAEQLADFTQIKLPTLYYHLGKMEADGLLSASREKTDLRPEKTVYSVTDKGKDVFQKELSALLSFDYRPTFSSDSVFFFAEHLDPSELVCHLDGYCANLKAALTAIRAHREISLQFVPDDARPMAEIIFSHHERHYQAELDWAQDTSKKLAQQGGSQHG